MEFAPENAVIFAGINELNHLFVLTSVSVVSGGYLHVPSHKVAR